MSDLETFLAGRAPDHVVVVLADAALDDPAALADYAEPVDGGRALVLGGARGRSVFQRATGQDPMAFARAAGDREGYVARDLSGGDCPAAGDGADESATADAVEGAEGGAGGREDHALRLLLAFAQARDESVGGLYAEGPVVHAYAQCACGVRYADRWVVDGA